LVAAFCPKISPPKPNPLPGVADGNAEGQCMIFFHGRLNVSVNKEHPLEIERKTRGSKKAYPVEEDGSEENQTHDEYAPQDIESEDSLSIYGDEEEANPKALKGKLKKPNRDDITAARQIKRQRSSSSTASKIEHNDQESR
jgi:hypothetical protein